MTHCAYTSTTTARSEATRTLQVRVLLVTEYPSFSFLFLSQMLDLVGGESESMLEEGGAKSELFLPTAAAMDPGGFIVAATRHRAGEHTATTI